MRCEIKESNNYQNLNTTIQKIEKQKQMSFYKDITFFNNQEPPVDTTMKRLSQKINDMSKSQNNNIRQSEFSTLQNRVQDIENKIQQSLKAVQKTIKQHKESLIEMNQKVTEIQSRNQLAKKVRTNQIKQLQTKITLWINMEKKARIAMQDKILQTFQEKFQVISLDLSKQIENRKQYLNSLDEKLAHTLPLLKGQIVEELQVCNAALHELQIKLEATTQEFKQSLTRNEEEHNLKMVKVMDLLSQTVTQVKKQINDERSERQMKKNQIMQLFQGAYKKLIL